MLRARYRRILLFFARALLALLLWEVVLPQVGFRQLSRRTRSGRLRQIAAAFRELAVAMGGVMIKVGQFLSSRLDVLPVEITTELAELQDEVPPEDFAAIRQVAEAELGAPLEERFAAFDPLPLAAASLGQVHRARLTLTSPEAPDDPLNQVQVVEGADVVVKVQRPDIDRIIATDVAALRTVGNWVHRYRPIRRRADVRALIREFTQILYGEIDYLAEGRNAETLAANFEGGSGICIPRVFWTHTTRRVLTLQDVYAIKITDYEAITAAGIDRAEVAQRLLDAYLQQIFEDGFFHADPHPGNLFVEPLDGEQEEGRWELTFVDFGMAGRVAPNLRAGLRELLIGAATRDAGRLVKSYQMLDVLLPSADLALLERAEAKAFERFWGKSITELRQISPREMHDFAMEFRELVYTMPFQLPQNLILLGRTVAILSGMCTGLYPQFNHWEALVPYAERLLTEGAASGWRYWLDTLGEMARALLALPGRAERALDRLERGAVTVRDPQLTRQVNRLEVSVRRLVGGVVFAALLTSGAQLALAGEDVLGTTLLAAAGVALAWVVLARRAKM